MVLCRRLRSRFIVLCEDWATVLKTTRVEYTGEEIKLPEPTTWALIAPALPPADLAESPVRELLRDPRKVLLPPTEWAEPVPQANVWVACDNVWADICKGCAQRGLSTFLQALFPGRAK